MHICRSKVLGLTFAAIALATAVTLTAAPPASADAVAPGADLFVTQPGTSHQDFSGTPIPPGFFAPGSEPFTGIIYFSGLPLGPLGPTDTVVERKAPAFLPGCPGSDTVPIEIIALSLVSASPITVTYPSAPSQLWDVEVTLSSITMPQPTGNMTIRHEHAAGGTFTATLPVQAKFIFTEVGNPTNQRILDTGGMLPPVIFNSNGHWMHNAPGFFITPSPGGIPYDNDKNPGTPSVILPASSNFIAGMRGVGGSCVAGPRGWGKVLTEEEALLAAHGVLPPQEQPPQPDGREGATCLTDGTCIITTPSMAGILKGSYRGDNELCGGDVNNDGCDDACAGVSLPGLTPWSGAIVVLLLLGSGLWFLSRRREYGEPVA